MQGKIRKIVLTGGPCAGKSVVLDSLKDRFGDDVILVPEVASLILGVPYDEGGIGVPGRDVEWSQTWQDELQRLIIDKQIADETYYVQLAEQRDRPTIVVCDRGVFDGAAYTDGGREGFLKKYNLDELTCMARYDSIIHLNSLAVDSPDLYEDLKITNPDRFEDSPRAKELDEKTYSAWEGHPNHSRIPSKEGVEQKIELCHQIVQELRQDCLDKINTETQPEEFISGLPVN